MCGSVLVWHFVLCSLCFRLVCHTISLFPLFLSRSFCVHHTWVKQPSQTLQLVLSHTGAEELLFVILAKTNCTRVKQWNEPMWCSKPCLSDGSGLFGLGLVCTCAGHTNWDVPLSAFGLDLGPILVGCRPLVWTLTSDISWYHKVGDFDVFCSHQLISGQRFVISEDWAAPRGLVKIVSVCVCVSYRDREKRQCVSHSSSLFLVYLHVSWVGRALYWCVFSLLQWCVWPIISLPYSIIYYYIAAVSISTYNSFKLNTTGSYRLDNLFSPQGVKYLRTGMFLGVSSRHTSYPLVSVCDAQSFPATKPF